MVIAVLLVVVTGIAATAAKRTQPALPNFHMVAEGIYRGGAPTQAGLQQLRAKYHIGTIIDLRVERARFTEKKLATQMGFNWVNLPMGREAPTQKQVDTFLDILSRADEEPVFVHCQHGADRTGAMIGIYRVQVQGWSFAQAWPEMRKYGFKPYLKELKEAVRSRAAS